MFGGLDQLFARAWKSYNDHSLARVVLCCYGIGQKLSLRWDWAGWVYEWGGMVDENMVLSMNTMNVIQYTPSMSTVLACPRTATNPPSLSETSVLFAPFETLGFRYDTRGPAGGVCCTLPADTAPSRNHVAPKHVNHICCQHTHKILLIMLYYSACLFRVISLQTHALMPKAHVSHHAFAWFSAWTAITCFSNDTSYVIC